MSYTVTSDGLKERIVLSGRPSGAPVYRFTVDLAGVTARPRGDGSIGFVPVGSADGKPLFVMPAPFMTDSAADENSSLGVGFSDKVTQSVVQHGSRLTVTVRADAGWLSDPKRKFPVVIDPTIRVDPTPTQAQDVMILKDNPGTNFEGTGRLDVGTTSTGPARRLLRFALPSTSKLPDEPGAWASRHGSGPDGIAKTGRNGREGRLMST